MKILIIEDERKLARFIKQGLEQHGHVADLAHSGSEGLDHVAGGLYDLVLLDLMLPGQTGFEVLQNLRAFGLSVPVMILSALSDPEKVVQGLDLGAVDYLRKPFDFSELLARIRVLQRRTDTSDNIVLRVADLEMRLVSHNVVKAGTTLELTNREFALLELLMRRAGHVVTKNEIAEKIWEVDYDMGSNVIEVHIYQVRKKIDAVGTTGLIETLIGRGYRLKTV
ncbi:response regulator transcription factor [Spirosoma endophyticum]|uniref:Two-component system, OmpR family, copper resistance phosphate regulon response regulator CusR n=1 Tax=Spirosoma endophyticum TaxID=662367 RepID=A0A1I1LFP2_9BACT|nr:response regulator transcription factor [Spirosoma endophyticum]SFC69183.1 two-component system, OmpR family, copper resistance phosphate regulon response regulator CusR [Spirosoma endophyticum]